MPFDPISYQLAKKAAARSVISYDRDGDGFIEYIATRKYETMPAVGAQYELAIDNADGYLKAFNPADNTWRRVSYAPLNGYSGFDNAGGGAWHNYINIPVTTIPSEYAQYRVVINGGTVEVYSVDGTLKASGSGLDSFWTYVRSDGLDIRVFDQAKSQLYFRIEEWDYINQKATIWVNLTAGSTELNIAYGNPSALKSSYEDPKQVFELFDDFEGDSLDMTWIITGTPSVTVSGGVVTIAGDTRGDGIIWNNDLDFSNLRIEAKIRTTSGDYHSLGIVWKWLDSDSYYWFGDWATIPKFAINKWHDGTETQFDYVEYGTSLNTWYIHEVTIQDNSFTAKLYDANRNLILQLSATDNNPLAGTKAGLVQYGLSETHEIDYIIAYKLADPADFGTPVISSFD